MYKAKTSHILIAMLCILTLILIPLLALPASAAGPSATDNSVALILGGEARLPVSLSHQEGAETSLLCVAPAAQNLQINYSVISVSIGQSTQLTEGANTIYTSTTLGKRAGTAMVYTPQASDREILNCDL